MSDDIYYEQASADRYMLAVLIALFLMVILMYAVALYYMRRKERAFVSSQAEMIRRTMLLEETQGQLEEKRRQSQSLLQKLRHSEMQENADDVIARVRLAADGKSRIDEADWKRLFSAVDSLYPDFSDMLLSRVSALNDQQMQVCYLMRIGMSNPQIRNITDLPRTTIWRWTKSFGWINELG